MAHYCSGLVALVDVGRRVGDPLGPPDDLLQVSVAPVLVAPHGPHGAPQLVDLALGLLQPAVSVVVRLLRLLHDHQLPVVGALVPGGSAEAALDDPPEPVHAGGACRASYYLLAGASPGSLGLADPCYFY